MNVQEPAQPGATSPQAAFDFFLPSGNDVRVQWTETNTIIVRELTAEQIKVFLSTSGIEAGGADKKEAGGSDKKNDLEQGKDILTAALLVIPQAIEGIDLTKLWQLKPSQHEILWKAFQKANAVFLKGVRWVGIEAAIIDVFKGIGTIVRQELIREFSDLLEMGIPTQNTIHSAPLSVPLTNLESQSSNDALTSQSPSESPIKQTKSSGEGL